MKSYTFTFMIDVPDLYNAEAAFDEMAEVAEKHSLRGFIGSMDEDG